MTTAYFTICAGNYLAFARSLGRSLATVHPESPFTIFLLDPDLPPGDLGPFRVRSIGEALNAAELAELRVYYDLLELATAVKPVCFRKLFDEGAARAIYLDPDVELFRPLDPVHALLDAGADGVVTPHVTTPLPPDGEAPDDLILLGAGLYNLGFLGLSRGATADALLAWWGRWLRTHGFADRSAGTFTDQKWINDAPLFWPSIEILRDPACNVAYWNLPQRELGRRGDTWTIDGSDLVFFHYSGFDPEQPGRLSKHQTRIDATSTPDLAALLAGYAKRLRGEGWADYRARPAVPSRFSDGTPVDAVAREAYRYTLRKGRHFREPLATGPNTLHDWLSAVAAPDREREGRLGLTRYLRTLHAHDPEVRAFPDPHGNDRVPFLRRAMDRASLDPGVDAEALMAQLPPIDPDGCRDEGLWTEGRPGDRADSARRFRRGWQLLAADLVTQDGVRAGYWDWQRVPPPTDLSALDEIRVPSRAIADAIGEPGVPVRIVPPPIRAPRVLAERIEFALLDTELLFLAYVDPDGDPRRSNPQGAVEAFCRRFDHRDDVHLVLVSEGGPASPELWDELRQLGRGARVSCIPEVLGEVGHYGLLGCADAVVSLHRFVGFGERIAEAMSLGKPVIATRWGGNLDYMTSENAFPVGFHAEHTNESNARGGFVWAEPNLDDAADALGKVREDRATAGRIGDRARLDLRRFAPAAVARVLADRS